VVGGACVVGGGSGTEGSWGVFFWGGGGGATIERPVRKMEFLGIPGFFRLQYVYLRVEYN